MSQPATPGHLRSLCATLTIASLLLGAVAQPALARPRAGASPADTLVAAIYFDGKTLDPAREFENMGNAADHALYDTLITFANGNLTTPVPDLATGWKVSGGGTVYTFSLRSGVKFVSGNPLTAADVVFSLERVQNLKGNPSFLLDNVASIAAPNAHTVTLTLKQADPAILSILPNPSLSIVDSKTVLANGGSDAPNADKLDKAESYLNAHSAGTGPYMLTAFNPGISIIMAANPAYWGPAPKLKKVTILNQQAPTEKLTLEKGDTDVALNLSPDQYPSLKGNAQLAASTVGSPDVFFLLLNLDPAISPPTADSNVRQAIRYALDYSGILALAGTGSVQAAGIVPVQYLGALPASAAPKQDLAKARALLARSGFAKGFSISLEYPSDITIDGENFNLLSQKVQSDLAALNIAVKLSPKPVAVSLPNYRAGKEPMGFWEWGPDYPDPSDYLNFLPGQLVGLRANWKAGADATLAQLMKAATTTLDNAKRGAIYQQIQIRLNAIGPFVPLFQPGKVVATQKGVTGFHFNAVWQLDFPVIGK